MPKLSAVVVTHKQINHLLTLVGSLSCQTVNDAVSIHVIHDGVMPQSEREIVEDGIEVITRDGNANMVSFMETHIRYNDWGHSLRDKAIKEFVLEDYVLLTNGDNYYMPTFAEHMLADVNDNVGVVYCDMVHSHPHPLNVPHGTYGYFKSEFLPCRVDIGAFIVRSDIARAVGFNSRRNEADADYIAEILEYRKSHQFEIVKVNKVLFVHN